MLLTCQEHCGHFRALTNSLREALTLSARRAQRMYWIQASPARSGDSCAAPLEHFNTPQYPAQDDALLPMPSVTADAKLVIQARSICLSTWRSRVMCMHDEHTSGLL